MKYRNGFVSNSSSSSFVLLKDSISNKQKDMIFNIEPYIDFLIKLDENNNDRDNLKSKFSNYNEDPWRIVEYEDFIFGETSMDNFSISNYFDYIGINNDYIKWDDGYNDEPYQTQLDFIKNMKNSYRKEKINKLNDLNL